MVTRKVISNQTECHSRLPEIVRRHLEHPDRFPVTEYNQKALQTCLQFINTHKQQFSEGLILDSGCGTGMSTGNLAKQYPGHLVIGVDKSTHRLGKAKNTIMPCNSFLVRAELTGLWKLFRSEGVIFEKHYVLYPNPWPKPKALQRRFHGNWAFPHMIAVSRQIIARSNWKLYLDEMAWALEIAGYTANISQIKPDTPISLFEKKYLECRHQIHELTANIV